MCGIYGSLRLDGRSIGGREALADMPDLTWHRGPDGEGAVYDGPLAMGMRRLAIIDVDGGQQPLYNEDRTVAVVCNGEIYNFRELTRHLEARGHRFGTKSDVEVIVHLYEEYGDDCVSHLRGMFSFALWDSARQRLLIARDRLGIKPLYIARQNGRLNFASELKAILSVTSAAAIDRAALREYLLLGYVPAPLSIVQGVEKLRPGCLMTVEAGKCAIHEYWRPVADEDHKTTEAEWSGQLSDALAASVERQLVSDVPLGAFLSGGIDSSAVVAMMARAGADPIRTYAIGFQGDRADEYYNELPYAAAIARKFGTNHREIVVKPDVAELLPRLLWHMDEPIADSAFLTTYLVAKFAREDVKVILSGAGGDELFGGYRRYLSDHYASMLSAIPMAIRQNVIRPIAERLPGDRHSAFLNAVRLAKSVLLNSTLPSDERYLAYVGAFGPQGVESLLASKGGATDGAVSLFFDAYRELGTDDPVQQCMLVDLKTQLTDDILMLTDRMTMATSLECRVPLLDEELVDLTLRMPASLKVRGRKLKYLLKEVMADSLGAEIVNRRKRGFGAPMGAWFKKELSPVVRRFLSRDSLEARGLFNSAAVESMIDAHFSGRADNTDKMLALLNLEIWCRLYLDNKAADEVSVELARAA
ncbi:asparagine synthase (glutamine-hydrolyzing) [Lentisalinibacter orientalis]|uniref:asparagine synthase (glutamine-hydrolyzing) n=1 Tax=Lentisalinibacter orientalis TaxID=2992241 RepID=UPI003866A4E2